MPKSGHPPRASPSPNPLFFKPGRGIVCDPVERRGLGLKASNVFLLPTWVGADHMPLLPILKRAGLERDFTCRSGHSINMRSIPDDCKNITVCRISRRINCRGWVNALIHARAALPSGRGVAQPPRKLRPLGGRSFSLLLAAALSFLAFYFACRGTFSA
jgi:hypothetical protein